jgi:hypothetical protein
LIEYHDEALNWDEPGSDLLWHDTQIKSFLSVAKEKYIKLCKELGTDYDILFIESI